jgi:hypothetical protein
MHVRRRTFASEEEQVRATGWPATGPDHFIEADQ